MAGSSTALRGGGARQQVIAAYNGSGGPAALCPLAVNGRFPFVAGSSLETPLDDFAKLFAPGGLIDGFFNTQLRPYVDTTGTAWKAQSVDGVPAPVSPADIAQFQRAAVIRDLFFAPGSDDDRRSLRHHAGRSRRRRFAGQPGVRRHVGHLCARPVALDPDRLAGAEPHAECAAGVRSAACRRHRRAGRERSVGDVPPVWARHASAKPARRERYTLSFALGNRQATFELRAASVLNPFAPGVLQDFRCPSVRD